MDTDNRKIDLDLLGTALFEVGVAKNLRELIREVYEDPTIADQRQVLLALTRGLDFESDEVDDERLKLILRYRGIVWGNLLPHDENKWTDLVLEIGDGDIAYRSHDYLGGFQDTHYVLGRPTYDCYDSELRYSPELQMEVIRGGHNDEDSDRELFQLVRASKYLTDEAQLALVESKEGRMALALNEYSNCTEALERLFLEGSDDERFLLIRSGRVFSSTLLDKIKADELWDLLYRAKTDAEAELQLIDWCLANKNYIEQKDGDENELGCMTIFTILSSLKLHSGEAIEKIRGSKGGSEILEMNLNFEEDRGIASEQS